jgi:hypothetical protein
MVALNYPAPTTLGNPGGVTELNFLLPTWQIDALAQVADQQGLTIAQLLRRLVNQTLEQPKAVVNRLG